MNEVLYNAYVKILKEELLPAMGCTEPIAVAYAAALVRKTLGTIPQSAEVHVSANIIKNVIRLGKVRKVACKCVEQSFEVGVDSGQAGFFDDAFYQNDTVFEELPAPGFAIGDLWYRHVCDITLCKMSAGVLPSGAVSSSGFGDGGYTCYTHADENGVIDFAFIVFI